MATRMQQRRGTASEWTSENPVLASGEFGFETDTSKFKIGDGINVWNSLNHFTDAAALLGAAPEALDTLAELAAAVNNDPDFYTTVVANASAISTNSTDIATNASDISTTTSDMIAGDQTLEDMIDALELSVTNAISQANTATDEALTAQENGLNSSIDAVSSTASSALALAGSANDKANANITALVSEQTTRIQEDADNSAETAAVQVNLDTEVSSRISADSTLTTAISDEASSRALALSTHNADTTSVHGIADTSVLATNTDVSNAQSAAEGYADGLAGNYDPTGTGASAQSAAQSFATSEVTNQNLVTTNVHGIVDTSLLVTTAGATFTGKLTLDGTPTQAYHAVTKEYADSISEGLSIHKAVLAATDGNIDLSSFTGAIDGVTIADTDRVLVKSQTDAAENGIYVYDSSASSFSRAEDFDSPQEIQGGDFVFVLGGTLYDNTGWVQVTDVIITIGTDAIEFSQFSGVGSVTAGANIEIAGTQISLVADPTLTNATITNLDITDLVFADGSQTGAGVLSITPISQKTASYALAATSEKDSVIEILSGSATTVTIPAESSVNFPVGSTLDILQAGTGQVTIAGASGVTVNSTPGLKLRAQWSSVTLLKRASDSWIVFGDTSA
tara:strand:+ start:1866 stop:3737 length:1872 start_codon:yes stop_codon:yes gene_type:complete